MVLRKYNKNCSVLKCLPKVRDEETVKMLQDERQAFETEIRSYTGVALTSQ
jgi:hypothetical protein